VPATAAKQSTTSSPTSPSSATSRTGGFSDYDSLFSHDWKPAPGQRGPDTYADLAAARADADERKAQREARILMEQREAEIERRERELKRKQDMAALEARRQQEAAEEQERRRKQKEALKNAQNQPKRPKFDFQKEKPAIMVSVANAVQASSALVNSCRVGRA
jgi:Skp family chaperone for outer membrane proteins